ncbi:helix-turn-helix domain-containing protein [Aliikangiella sp. IMCC44653]
MHEALQKAVQHWSAVAPVVETPTNPNDYETLLKNLEDAIRLVENRPKSPLASLIKAMGTAAKEYEDRYIITRQENALYALRYLIKLHGLKQSELKEVGSQGVVSEILNGKRSLTIRHVKELARRFKVSPNVFIDA